MSEPFDLNFVFPDDDGERLAMTARIWSEPVIPTLRHMPPRLRQAGGWTPFRNHILVRTIDHVSGVYDAVLSNVRPGSVIEFHLGCVSEQPWPESRRLVRCDGRYLTLAEYEPITGAMTSLGFIGTVPFPMLDALEARRMGDGQEVLVAGDADALRARSEPIGTLGFVEPFPLRPRRPPPAMARALRPLLRWFDTDAQSHRYGWPSVRPGGAVCLGSVRTALGRFGSRAGDDEQEFVPLRLSDDDTVGESAGLIARARWTAAPLAWRRVRARQQLEGVAMRARDLFSKDLRSRPQESTIGYLRASPGPHHSPLYAAAHPVTGDVFLTRSAIEAGDMGYGRVRRLGWIADIGADRRPGSDTIWWASRFGQFRRYHEGTEGAAPHLPEPATSAPASSHGTALLEAGSAAGLARLGVVPEQCTVVIRSESRRALAVAVSHPEASLLAIVFDSHERCAERCGVDYVVISVRRADERNGRLAELDDRYESVCRLEPDVFLGPRADPFVDPEDDVARSDRSLPFTERRRRLLEAVAERSSQDGEVTENRR
jgi:hypothetical protein